MSFLFQILIAILALATCAFVLRWLGQKVMQNTPYFRDMPYSVALGYVFGTAALVWVIYTYAWAKITGYPEANRYFFFIKTVEWFVIFALAAYVFSTLGKYVGTQKTRKLFRQMPLTAAFGIMIILVYAIVSIFAAWIAPYGQEQIFEIANIPPGGDPAFGGNPQFPMGTDQIGRDIYSRLIYGAQNTVGIAFATTCLAFFVGGSLGFLAATLGGVLDNLLSRLVDVLMAIPALIFALLLMTIATVWANTLGLDRTIFMVVIIALIDSTRVYRLARAVGQNIVVMDYIEAARLRGEKLSYLIFREILPNASAPLMVEFGLRFCFVFLTIASLSFLGVGIQPPLADWGTMVKDLSQFINFASFAPQVASAPLLAAAAIALLTVAVNFVVDWMLHKSSGLKE